jgi:hypothetical protein
MESSSVVTYCSVCGDKFYTPESALACKHDSPEKFAVAFWVVGDITGIAPSLSEDEAVDWLANNEDNLQSLMIERGWNAIYDLLAMDGIPTPNDPNSSSRSESEN